MLIGRSRNRSLLLPPPLPGVMELMAMIPMPTSLLEMMMWKRSKQSIQTLPRTWAVVALRKKLEEVSAMQDFVAVFMDATSDPLINLYHFIGSQKIFVCGGDGFGKFAVKKDLTL